MRKAGLWLAVVGLVGCTTDPELETSEEFLTKHGPYIPNNVPIVNEHGLSTTVSTQGGIDLGNEFFQDLGTNGRRCISCHLPTAGWSVTPEEMQATFWRSRGGTKDDFLGLGAVFRINDGANSPNADVSTLDKRREAYSMLLEKGVIRVGMGIPAGAEFELVAVDDPYGFASAQELSLFRRPLPATNLKFLSAVMWDGRETFKDANGDFESIHFDLSHQANGATTDHAQSPVPLTDAQRESIVAFESSLHTAQTYDWDAGGLDRHGGRGGPAAMIDQAFYIGINDVFGDPVSGEPFDPVVFDLYDSWDHDKNTARARVARGQTIFNTRRLVIEGVGGINDDFGIPSLEATCSFCHDSPNGGDHSTAVPLNIGIAEEAERTPDLPLYVLRCNTGSLAGKMFRVTDPGRALISGKCKDIGRFKGPILRGLATRAPYFHNGSAASLRDVVDFYDRRFNMNLSAGEKRDLVAFLATL